MAITIRGAINPTSVSVPTSHLAEILDDGGEPTDSFTVTKNLTHAVIKNERISGSSYYAEVEPAENWSDLSVTIKVGGVDMSNLYTSGVINIPNVTGNIVITAAAAQAALVSITAVYTQSGTVYDTDSLDSLKSDLVVTATYADSSTATVTDYTLSGTLAEGTSTVTVSYGGKTDTISVVVSAPASVIGITATFAQGANDDYYAIDPLEMLKWNLVVTKDYSDNTAVVLRDDEYTLSGTLTVGTSTVTATYGNYTDTFNVTVSANPLPTGYTMYNYVNNPSANSGCNVDTGLSGAYCTEDYKHDFIYKPVTSAQSTTYPLYGIRTESGSDPTARVLWSQLVDNETKLAYAYHGEGSGYIYPTDNNKLYKCTSGGSYWKMNNDTVKNDYDEAWEPYTGGNIVLFGIWQSTASTPVKGGYTRQSINIYRFKVTQISTGNVIANLIPCKNTNGRSGFYDIVARAFRTAYSSGNTIVVAGNDT